jgi:hypothetical protein
MAALARLAKHGDLSSLRDLAWRLLVRDISATYRQSALGYALVLLVIGFAESLYAISGWAALMRAVDASHWTVNGRSVVLCLLGSAFRLRSPGPAAVEYLGFRSLEETTLPLAACDVNYMFCLFEKDWSDVVRDAFSAKFSAYAAAARPVLVMLRRDPRWRLSSILTP